MSFLLPIYMISWPAAFILLGISARTDLKDRIIPNELVVAIAAIGVAQALLARPGLVWLSLLAAAIVFCGLGILSHYKIIGGGDTKLISAVTFLVRARSRGTTPDRNRTGWRSAQLPLPRGALPAQKPKRVSISRGGSCSAGERACSHD